MAIGDSLLSSGVTTATGSSTVPYAFDASSLNPFSKLSQPMSSKAQLKKGLNENKLVEAVKSSIYPTIAAGSKPNPDQIDYYMSSADYYRGGKFFENGKYAQYPRSFEPYETQENSLWGQTYTASIRIFGKGKKGKEPTDLIPAYTKFILESVQEAHAERSQIIETFGDFYVFMFGQRPPMYTFTGTLVNSKNASWVTDFMFMYDQYLRGTKCVENNAVTLVTYGGRQVEGLILNTSNQTTAAVEGGVPFQFSVVVFERRFYNFSEDMGYYYNGDELTEDTVLTNLLNQVAGLEGKGTSGVPESLASQELKDSMINGTPLQKLSNLDYTAPRQGPLLP